MRVFDADDGTPTRTPSAWMIAPDLAPVLRVGPSAERSWCTLAKRRSRYRQLWDLHPDDRSADRLGDGEPRRNDLRNLGTPWRCVEAL